MADLLHEIKTLLNYSVWFRGGHICSMDVWQGGGNSEPVAKLVRGDFEELVPSILNEDDGYSLFTCHNGRFG
jgi:hypothetical protein